MLNFSKKNLNSKEQKFWRKIENLLEYFNFNMKSSNLIKSFDRHVLKLPLYYGI
jgi:hypothetical protein